MKITLNDMAKALGVSVNTTIRIKFALGYGKGGSLDSDMIEEFRKKWGELRNYGGRKNPEYPEFYKIAVSKLEKDGYIKRNELLQIFQTGNAPNIEKYFENRENPLYDEVIIFGKTKKNKPYNVKVYKLLKPVFKKWKEESKMTGLYNNTYNGAGNSYYNTSKI